jgi:hypothetical protein
MVLPALSIIARYTFAASCCMIIMIEYLGIQDNGKLIEHYTTGVMSQNDINGMLSKLAKQKSPSKVIQQLRSN